MLEMLNGISYCSGFDCECEYQGKCEECPIFVGYQNYCKNEEEIEMTKNLCKDCGVELEFDELEYRQCDGCFMIEDYEKYLASEHTLIGEEFEFVGGELKLDEYHIIEENNTTWIEVKRKEFYVDGVTGEELPF